MSTCRLLIFSIFHALYYFEHGQQFRTSLYMSWVEIGDLNSYIDEVTTHKSNTTFLYILATWLYHRNLRIAVDPSHVLKSRERYSHHHACVLKPPCTVHAIVLHFETVGVDGRNSEPTVCYYFIWISLRQRSIIGWACRRVTNLGRGLTGRTSRQRD